MKKSTLVDIAKLSNVSQATVSRVLNGSEKISDETRQKVLKAAAKLNYVRSPNSGADIGIGIVDEIICSIQPAKRACLAPKRSSKVDALFSQMMDKLASGEWSIGQRIPSENELADLFGVSRVSIRQSIQRLNALGILEARLGDGTFIKSVDSSNYLNSMLPTIMLSDYDKIRLVEFHKGLQVESSKLACVRRTDEQIMKINQCIFLMKTYSQQNDVGKFLDMDLECHKVITEMTNNEMFIKATDAIYKRLRHYLEESVTRYGFASSILYHDFIAKAITDRNPSLASSLMESHMDEVLLHLVSNEK